MIGKINKIKHLGLVFSNYAWEADLPLFKQVNLIYGWNGCGKTTLSRLFSAIGGVPIKDVEYEIEDDQGVKFKQGEAFPQSIRVFNHDYVQSNLKIIDGQANSISILLGEENKALADEIEADKKLLNGDGANPTVPGKLPMLTEKVKDRDRKAAARDAKFTEIAKTIGAAIGGNALRDYRKPQAEKDFFGLLQKAELSETDLGKFSLSAKQESSPSIDLMNSKKLRIGGNGDEFELVDLLKSIEKEADALLAKTVESEAIPRLQSNSDISNWVERGFHLHKDISSNICEFCLEKLPTERLGQLARHFNEADKKLKDDIDTLTGQLNTAYVEVRSLQAPDKVRLYAELRADCEIYLLEFEAARKNLLGEIETLIGELKGKKSKTTESLLSNVKLGIGPFVQRVAAINDLIQNHNKKTSDFEAVKKEAVKRLKQHYLSTIFGEVNKLKEDVATIENEIGLLKPEIEALQDKIADNMAKISSEHRACEVINQKLSVFLGHSELSFIPRSKMESDKTGKAKELVAGYSIMRGTEVATYLSEGEKTAIAFVYFIVHLGDQHFKVADGIIVVDDPISSLDSNSTYQAFSFLKNAVKDGKQVFIFTHSFDFLKLLINWRRHGGGAGYYMIKNKFPADVRCACIDKMDRELCEYESEYHYLFKLLKELRDEQDDSIAKAYPIPNIARKVWDTFLMFSVPDGAGSPYKKMALLKEAGHDEQKLDAIYKFTNDQSHITGAGFNPALVPETKKVIKELFEMMAQIAPRHFAIIDKATG